MAIIAHLDMDAFFASVEERENPRFRGVPLVVGSDPQLGRGVVSTANYPARRYGIHSAMSIKEAWRRSELAGYQGQPKVIFLPVNMRHYEVISKKIFAIVQSYSPRLESASIDECYFDLTATGSFARAEKIAQKIKTEIKNKEQLSCSIGIAPNKLVAKIATGQNKPAGLTLVQPAELESFLAPLLVRELPGVGPKLENQLAKLKIKTIQDLRALSEATLYDQFGEHGISLYEKARGQGETELAEEWTAKSIGEQETLPADTLELNLLFTSLERMAETIVKQLRASGFTSFRTLVLIVRLADFKTYNCSRTLATATNQSKILRQEALKLLLPFLDRRKNSALKPIRLIGLRVEKLQ